MMENIVISREKNMELPIEICQICQKKLHLSENLELNVSECSKCHCLACSECIDYHYDLKKWLCKKCYLELKPKTMKTLLSFIK